MKFFYLVFILCMVSGIYSNAQIVQPDPEPAGYDNEYRIDTNKVYTYVGEWPEFPGGNIERNKFLSTHLVYPKEAEVRGIEGRVIVGFTVDKTGEILDVKILKSVDLFLDREAARVVRMMPRWKPGRNNGVAVKTRHKIDVLFYLSKGGGFIKRLECDSSACNVYPTFGSGTPFAFQQSARLIMIAQGPINNAGSVTIGFTITKDNELLDITVIKATDPMLEEDALNVIRKLRGTWKAGLKDGKTIDVKYQADFIFNPIQ